MELSNFTEEQIAVITAKEGNYLVLAGAGAGKTSSLIKRVEKLVNSGVRSSEILLLTFSRKAAHEIIERLEKVELNDVEASTFHSFAYRMLIKLNYKIDILDEETLDEIYDLEELDENQIKNFHTLIDKFITLLKDKKLDKYIEKYKYLLIDEYQDSDDREKELLIYFHKLGSNIMVVGDDFQSIYGFRGSKVENILNFSEYIPCTTLKLQSNFRSTSYIVDVINSISNSMKYKCDKSLVSKRVFEDIKKPEILKFPSCKYESIYIGKYIKEYISRGGKYSDICVLYRNNFQSFELLAGLRAEKVDVDKVTHMTIHKSKGLEWKIVILCNMQEGILPGHGDIEEELRIFYVACSRSQEKLIITYSNLFHGPLVDYKERSQFLDIFSSDLVKFKEYK